MSSFFTAHKLERPKKDFGFSLNSKLGRDEEKLVLPRWLCAHSSMEPPGSWEAKQLGKLWSFLQGLLLPFLSDVYYWKLLATSPFHSVSAAGLILSLLVCFHYSQTAMLEGGSGKRFEIWFYSSILNNRKFKLL